MIKTQETWQTVRGLTGGWNSFNEAADIGDTEVIDPQNVIYDGGFIQSRPGSTKLTDKPVGAGKPLQLFVARTSDGIEYTIGVYDNKFFLWHETNQEWVNISMTYVPTQTTRQYGYVSWNNGRGDDRLYCCNGVDDFGKWMIAVDTVALDTPAGSSTITLTDSTRFPSSGTVVIKDATGNDFTADFTANVANVLTLTTPLSSTVEHGASIAMSMQAMPGMELGKVVAKWQGRLIVANYYGGETVLWYSVLSSPEDFTTGTSIPSAGTEVIADGNGEITALNDFGSFLVIEKEDSFHSFQFQLSSDFSSKQSQIDPVLSGQSVGPLVQGTVVRSLNKLMYPTRTEGFMQIEPTSTGSQVTITPTTISAKIQPTVTKMLSYLNCKGVVFDQKAIWAVALKGATQNILCIYYDTLRGAWSSVFGWSVQDFAEKSNQLFYLDNSTGAIYEIFTNNYTDADNPYIASFRTKKMDFNALAQPKTADGVFVQGYITAASKLYVDVLLNEEGSLGKLTYLINKDTPGIQLYQPIDSMLSAFRLADMPFGWIPIDEIGSLSYFRIYLGVPIEKGFYNLSLRFRSSNGAFFGITGFGVDPQLAGVIPSEMVASPISSIL